MSKHLSNKLFREQLKQIFSLEGNADEMAELQEVLQMIASVPTGQKLLQKIIAKGKSAKISFVPFFEKEEPNWSTKGQFYRNESSITILKIDTDLPDMTRKTRLQSKLMMARTLAHELQHHLDIDRNDTIF